MIEIPKFDFVGIKRIEIPVRDSDFLPINGYGYDVIKRHLANILGEHAKNAKKEDYLYKFYQGIQDVRTKTRRYKIDMFNNNIVIENHAARQVDFKVGFLCGENRDYTHETDTKTDDLLYFNRYLKDVNFYSKDKDVKRWVYATGIGTTYTAPRLDIIVRDGDMTRYATVDEGFDIDFNAPFEFYAVDPRENFVVYSSGFNKEPLFCVSIVDVEVKVADDSYEIRKEIQIETKYATFRALSDAKFVQFTYGFGGDPIIEIKPKALNYLPIIEHYSNDDRIGIVERNRSLFNQINTIRSSIVDMTVDSANAIMVFKNVDIDGAQIQAMKEAGAIVISDPQDGRGAQADFKSVKMEMPLDALNDYINEIIQQMYDIAGVPLASGAVTSGGDTGQARLLGGGWNNAYIIANDDINTFKGRDYEELKLILLICKQVPNCPLDKTQASQIDINYRINQNDNYLVKTQGMTNLYNIKMPLEAILKSSGLFNDIKTLAKEWQLKIDESKAEENEDSEQDEVTTAIDRQLPINNGNDSQE